MIAVVVPRIRHEVSSKLPLSRTMIAIAAVRHSATTTTRRSRRRAGICSQL